MISLMLISIGDDDSRAFCCKCQRDAAADIRRAAGDQYAGVGEA